jgi:3-methyl-2-oxobutanoate hydroxymethyltransferase
MGHVGLTPRTTSSLGGFVLQGKEPESAKSLMADALACREAGCFAIVPWCLPSALAQATPRRFSLQAIGDGAGPGHAGHNRDAYGASWASLTGPCPSSSRRYIQVGLEIAQVFDDWRKDVMEGRYPLAGQGLNVLGREIAGLHNADLYRD